MKPTPLLLTATLIVACLIGCATQPRTHVERQWGESVVFIEQAPSALAHLPLRGYPLVVRDTYPPGQGSIEFAEGRDFVSDYEAGTICRSAPSLLPDFQTNRLFAQEGFDHTKFPGFGNGGFFAFVDYSYSTAVSWPVPAPQTPFLKSTRAKQKSGGAVKIVAFGDSITAGGEASQPELIFWQRWADWLRQKYPQARVTAVNGATGGDSTVQGLRRLQTKVIERKPDLVLIGFGMNDQNVGGAPIPRFEENLKQMIARIRSETGAEIVLFSAFPPNPRWKFSSHHMPDYAAATRRVALSTSCAYADVFSNWESMAARKKPEDPLSKLRTLHSAPRTPHLNALPPHASAFAPGQQPVKRQNPAA